MHYESTRGGEETYNFSEVIKMGIANNGGLFVPNTIEKLDRNHIEKFIHMNYLEISMEILKIFCNDFTKEEIKVCVNNAYTQEKFSNQNITPLIKLNENINILELWHGPTQAFKDIALQILPHMLQTAYKKTNETNTIVILVATSGDTGKAALEGFRDVSNTKVIVFYPNDKVSLVQKLQMITQQGSNVDVIAVNGNFDDAQTGVKNIFSNKEFKELMLKNRYVFSSANSINWGRLVPQIVYYFFAYTELVRQGSIKIMEKINFVVPTGNFGNILAGYYALMMGLPINKLICASNDNNVLTDFINSGKYDINRKFKQTNSPSMDILISSNLERLLYALSDKDSWKINNWMTSLKTEGSYTIDTVLKKKISEIFWGDYSSESEVLKTIECIFNEYNYVLDTHTAVGVDVYDKYVISTGDITKTVILSTASPFKFSNSVVRCIFPNEDISQKDEFEIMDILSSKCKIDIPINLKALNKKPILHKTACQKDQMNYIVKNLLGI